MKLKTGIAVLSANALLVLLLSQAVRGEAPAEGSAPLPLVEASVTVPETRDPLVVEGALSSNNRGWTQASETAVSGTEMGVRTELLDAYSLAVAASPMGCNLTVSVLAAIGQVESGNLVGHGLDSEHRAVPAILGPVLDGKKFAAIEDTDEGKLDGDTVWDRAVGPMQFVPASWRVAGVDMDGDGRRDPQDVDDAAGTAMVYLCAGGRDLATEDGLREAVLSYNHSAEYLRLVLAWKTVFDRNPLTGWAALPLLDAWQLTPVIPATLPPAAGTDLRTTAPALNAWPATQGVPSASPTTPVSPATSPATSPVTPGATPTTKPSVGPTPTVPVPVPSAPATEPTPTPTPTPEPLPTCPVPTPVDPTATPTPTETPDDTTGDTGTTTTADIPGDGTEKPVECVLPLDPETGLPMTPAPQAVPSTEPDASSAG